MNYMLPQIFWQTAIPIQKIPSLDTLRSIVLERNPKRLPKWKFLTANGIVIALQPKIKPFEGFQGLAVLQDEFRLGFRLIYNSPMDPDDDDNLYWGLLPWSLNIQDDPFSADHDFACSVRDWVISNLEHGFKTLRPEMMLKPACLLCGRKLTDPISQARWIGPECNGSAAALNPFIIKLTADLITENA
jgi:hypothetical protein